MAEYKSTCTRGDEDLFLERHNVRGVTFLISKNRVQINVLGRSGSVENLAAPEIIICP